MARRALTLAACAAAACGAEIAPAGTDAAGAPVDAARALPDAAAAEPCPADMVFWGETCFDRWEAPNAAGEPPLVMYTFVEAEAWCEVRGKRLCFDSEWTDACAGPEGWPYPYGPTREAGTCNDEETWRLYDQDLLDGWPAAASSPEVGTLDELLTDVRAVSPGAAAAADHIAWLYQGETAGANPGCAGVAGVEDLVGNVEEWTRRRDGGMTDFHGNLKGRYWAEPRTCLGGVLGHGDGFRFYEIGFRCCRDPR